MVSVLAHFTAAELPGTAAILLTGLAVGLAARSVRGLAVTLLLCATLALGLVAALADHAGWAGALAGALGQTGWDWLWLASAALAAGLAAHRRALPGR
jgi:hypothetical protein